jgi:hypothetical protein
VKHIGCLVAIAICLVIFGMPLIGTFTFLLTLPGLEVDTAFRIATIATVAIITAMGIRTFYK